VIVAVGVRPSLLQSHQRALSLSAAIASATLSGCVHYQARPIDPAATVERLDVRTLADPGLARAVEPAHPSGTWPPEVWDLQALTLAGLYFHSDLAVARASWGVTRASIITAGEKPNPGVNAGPGYNSSTPADTITPWILGLDLDFTIETAGKRRIRIDEAKRLSESARYKIAHDVDQPIDEASVGKRAVLAGVREFPVRVTCASFAWHTLKAALEGADEPVKTEWHLSA
jgi:hypothetical protein